MEAIIATYPCDAHVPIYYDPAAPARSVIEPANRTAYAPHRNMGVLLTLFGALALAGIGFWKSGDNLLPLTPRDASDAAPVEPGVFPLPAAFCNLFALFCGSFCLFKV